MPIYEYECPLCGVFEVTQKVSEKPLKAKPECDRKNCPRKAERLISASAFHLKGGGWYKTDYASSSGNTGKNESSSKAEEAPTASTAESKPAAAPEKSESTEKTPDSTPKKKKRKR